jgi:PmbA protein
MIRATDLVQEIVRRARRAGAQEAEAYFEDRQKTRIELRDQQVEMLSSAATRGLGLRVLVDGAASYVYTSDLRPRAFGDLARRAVALAREASPDPDGSLPEVGEAPSGSAPSTGSEQAASADSGQDLNIFDPNLSEVEPERKIELLRAVERVARETDQRVRDTEVARYSDSFGTVTLANSRGLCASFERSFASVALVAIARQEGEALRGYGVSVGHGFGEISADDAGWQAAQRAVKPLGGRPLETQKATVVMEPDIAAELLRHIANALSGEAVLKGRSMFVGRLGERVGPDLLTLLDQGNLPGGLASAPFDGEGVACGRSVLVEDGLLRGFLHNTYTARRTGASSTGNAVRGSYRERPEVGSTNFSLSVEAMPLAQLLGGVQRGLHVLTTRNVGGINPVNGDYSVGAAGVWLEDGNEAGPVAGVTIAANMHDMLANLAAVADDFRWSPGAIGCGTIRIEGMTIAGT